MSGAYEALERAEQAAHGGAHHAGGHGGDSHSSGKMIGLTMALIGVLIAFCAAMVGSERNELTKSMIEQTQAHADNTSASTKFRIVMVELEKQRGAAAASTTANSQPARPVLNRFLRLYVDYSKERSLSQAWADSYQPLIDAHFEAAEGFERAQLIAEIGIVIASLAVLLASRPAWMVSVLLAVVCIGQLTLTKIHTGQTVGATLGKVDQTEEAYKSLRKAHIGVNEDEKTVDELDPEGKIRADIEAASKEKGPEGAPEGAPKAEKG